MVAQWSRRVREVYDQAQAYSGPGLGSQRRFQKYGPQVAPRFLPGYSPSERRERTIPGGAPETGGATLLHQSDKSIMASFMVRALPRVALPCSQFHLSQPISAPSPITVPIFHRRDWSLVHS